MSMGGRGAENAELMEVTVPRRDALRLGRPVPCEPVRGVFGELLMPITGARDWPRCMSPTPPEALILRRSCMPTLLASTKLSVACDSGAAMYTGMQKATK